MATYYDIVASLKAFTEDNDTEFDAVAQTVVSHGETRLAHDLDLEENIALYQTWFTTTIAGSRYVARNPSWGNIHWVSMIVSDTHTLLEKRTESWMLDYTPGGTTYGVPKYYGDWDDDYLIFAPVPALAYTVHVKADAKMTGLSPATPTTYLSDKYSNALVYACLVASEVFHKSPELVKLYTEQYDKAREGIVLSLREEKFDSLAFNKGRAS